MKIIPQYHSEVIGNYPKGEWVMPSNNGSNDFYVFADLFEWGLCERKIEYQYRDNGKTLCGSKVYFKY